MNMVMVLHVVVTFLYVRTLQNDLDWMLLSKNLLPIQPYGELNDTCVRNIRWSHDCALVNSAMRVSMLCAIRCELFVLVQLF